MLSPPNDSIGLGKYTLSVYEIYNIFVCVFFEHICCSNIAIVLKYNSDIGYTLAL